MNHLVATNSQTHHPLAQNLLKSIAAVCAAVVSLAGSAFAAGTNSVSLAWDPNPETNIAGYRLQYGLTPGNYPSVVDAGAATSATANGLNQGTTYYFTVVAYNSAGQFSPASSEVTYTVPGAPNTAPSATSFSVTVAEDSQNFATLGGTDGEGDLLTYSIVSAPAKGTLSGTAPNLIYRPAANVSGSDSFTYRANDGAVNSATATVSITILPMNDQPSADAKTFTVQEDGQVAATLTGSDPDGDTLIYSIVTAPTKGTLTGSAPNFTYRPAANLNGSDSFTYRVSDGASTSATVTANITISAVNDIPVANPQSLTTAEDTPISVNFTGSDVEGSTLTYAVVSPPGNGTLSGTPPNLTFTPAANFSGTVNFPFRVNDGTANSGNALIVIVITPVNDAPTATPLTVSTAPGSPAAVALSGNDIEGSALSYAIVAPPANGSLSGTAPNLTYTATAGYTGNDSFTYRVNDGSLNSPAATVSISVGTSNRTPQAHGKSMATMMNKAVSVILTGSDADADAISYRIVSQPTGGSLSGTPPNVKYTPKAKWTGNDQFTYVVNDGKADSPAATVNLKVKGKNLKPVATARTATATQNTAATVVVAGSDPDGDPLSFVVVKQPANGSVSGTGPNFVYVPKSGFKGKDSFTFAASDGAAKSKPATVAITVVNPNNKAPVAIAQSVSGAAKKLVAVTLRGTDPDSDALTFRVVSKPASGKLTGKGANLKFKPAATFSGTVTFTYVANDGSVDSAPATVTLTIGSSAAAPRSLAAHDKSAEVGGPEIVPGLAMSRSPAGEMILRVTGVPGQRYTLEHSESLTGWAELQSVDIPGTGSIELEVVVPEGSRSGFFRLQIP
ncbi:Ig-like domain-containing protein [Luteolibacter arcticus]|uniref:Ig-like domain-containing protein n=1 Tax=Luteolibacter arcticus TaxID=1581411 RepID=A0ABT3GBB2_9BACT|nr:Ig-like domain-containing protein [Luteolibacter arcticus]MCW1920918.1 Ig-like domain-containing protein [Luteolibacter arcticus]